MTGSALNLSRRKVFSLTRQRTWPIPPRWLDSGKTAQVPDHPLHREVAGALVLVNLYPEHPTLRGMSSQKAALGNLAKEFVSRIVRDNERNSSAGSWREHLQELATNERLLGTSVWHSQPYFQLTPRGEPLCCAPCGMQSLATRSRPRLGLR